MKKMIMQKVDPYSIRNLCFLCFMVLQCLNKSSFMYLYFCFTAIFVNQLFNFRTLSFRIFFCFTSFTSTSILTFDLCLL
ncbi:hypothetical protein C0J52_10219 [Blattella germanica]|nr:hypothetical protein C0J52_10219 [Blattella germanica]